MTPLFTKLFFVAGTVLYTAIRMPFAKRRRKVNTETVEREKLEKALLLGALLGMDVIPLIYIVSPLFSFADYSFHPLNGWIGVMSWIFATFIFWKSHKDLGLEWSPVLAIKEQHQLIASGIYRRIRQPMYTSIWMFTIAQAFLLPNWIAGFSGVISFAILYCGRVKAEEDMLQRHFGKEYDDYMRVTGRLFPKMK